MTTIEPLDPNSEVVDNRRRWTPAWYAWLTELCRIVSLPSGGGGGDITPDWVNVTDFGAVPNDSSIDNAPAIQAAIDFACENKIRTIYVPSGTFWVSAPIFLDPPDNLRVNLANPPRFNFALSLVGDEASSGNVEGFGSRIKSTVTDGVVLWVGTGQGMLVKHLTIEGPTDPVVFRGLRPKSSVGIGIAGGSGGVTRYTLENCMVGYHYTGIKVDANGNGALGDSGTYIKVWVHECHIGFHFASTQNFINSLYDCQAHCSRNVVAEVGTGAHIWGGNWSAFSPSSAFGISGLTMSTTPTDIGNHDVHFTCTIANPDQYVGSVYNAYAIVTENFGIVPARMNTWDAATRVATFTCLAEWSSCSFPAFDPANSELETDLQAATTIFASELCVAFSGANITVYGIHLESDQGTQALVNSDAGFGDQRPNTFEAIYYNYDPGHSGAADSADLAIRARHIISMSHPHIRVGNTELYIRNSQFQVNRFNPIPVSLMSNSARFMAEGVVQFHVNIRAVEHSGQFIGAHWQASSSVGSAPFWRGEFDRPCTLSMRDDNLADTHRSHGWGTSRFWGVRPALDCSPGILKYMAEWLMAGVSNLGLGRYPIMWGGQQYKLVNDYMPASANGYNVISDHHFYTYGQDLTTLNVPGLSWRYKGKSFCVYLDFETHRWLFPGLGIMLNDGYGDVLYIVTGRWPRQGYITVQQYGGNNMLSGSKSSIVTGSVIKQEPFAITQF